MNSFIGIRQDQQGGQQPPSSSASTDGQDAVEYDEMDAVIHNDEEAAADFLERLGDLDQFVATEAETIALALGSGAGATAALRNHAPVTTGFDSSGEFIVADPVDLADTAALGLVDDGGPFVVADTEHADDEAQEFLDRLGDLDRFIATVPDDEVTDFHQRLSELDRFVSGSDRTAPPASLCAACRKPVSPTDPSAVHAVHLLGAIEGRQIEGMPRQFHATCWIDGDGSHRRTR
ncbi:MAG: hypothetical protein GX868_02390 [Actinobacteria bacterium]|nr:hypothetical protein [Actinomycetota bacterium]